MTDRFVIETTELYKNYGAVKALCGLNVQVPRGSIYGFLGRNGAGKTTTIKVLLGMVRATSGVARVFGLPSGREETSVAIRRRTGFVSEDKDLYDYMTVEGMIRFTAAFYTGWRIDLERRYLRAFELPVGSAVGAAETPQGAIGHWEGRLQMSSRELGMAVDLARDAKGAWIGSISVARTSAKDVPLGSLKVTGATVKFTADLPDSAVFEGSLSEDESSLSGKASNPLGSVPFELTRQGAANVSVPPQRSVLSEEFAGLWEGTLTAFGKELRIRLELAPAADGLATAILTSVDRATRKFQ
jgi:ABC-type Fe3+/spermidine/putrescine transport system ATPase subunit